MASKIGKTEWKIVYAAAGIIDIAQWVLDFIIGPGEAVNEIADPIIGVLMAGYFQLRGVSMTQRPQRLIAMIGGYAAEALTVSVAPAWIIDVWYMRRSVKEEEAAMQAAQAQQGISDQVRNPAYAGGRREPPQREGSARSAQPAVVDGVRPPNGGTGNNVVKVDFRKQQQGNEETPLEEAA